MFSKPIFCLVLASVNMTTASLSSTFLRRNMTSTPHISGGRITKSRKAKSNNKYSSSSYHPHILTSDHLQFWSSPHVISHQNAIISHIPATISANLMDVMLLYLEEKTQSNYGARLLHFAQFCDTHGISEAD
jgi:hypothetical protein